MDGGLELPREPAFPSGWGERAPWSAAGARGVRWAPLSPALERLFAGWVQAGHARPALELEPGVFRAGALVAKFFPPPPLRRRLTSPDTARRAAELALAIRPLPAPRPLLAVGAVGPRRNASLLVSEFVGGPTLAEAWDTDERARAALPDFLARMHAQGVHHGDLHPGNLLWDGERLVLIDVTAVRRGLHLFLARRLALYQWARLVLYLGDLERLRLAFERYAELRGWSDAAAGWRGVLARTRSLMRRRAQLPPRAPVLS
jgi:hypothetical protein